MPAYCVVKSCSSPCTLASKPRWCAQGYFFYSNQSRFLTHQSQKRIFTYIHISLVTELSGKWSCLGYKLVLIVRLKIGIKFRVGLYARFQFPLLILLMPCFVLEV